MQWGLKRSKTDFILVSTLMDHAPEALIKFIYCKSKTRCGTAYGCRKAGQKSSLICLNCHGESCANVQNVLGESSDDSKSPIETLFLNVENNDALQSASSDTEPKEDFSIEPSTNNDTQEDLGILLHQLSE